MWTRELMSRWQVGLARESVKGNNALPLASFKLFVRRMSDIPARLSSSSPRCFRLPVSLDNGMSERRDAALKLWIRRNAGNMVCVPLRDWDKWRRAWSRRLLFRGAWLPGSTHALFSWESDVTTCLHDDTAGRRSLWTADDIVVVGVWWSLKDDDGVDDCSAILNTFSPGVICAISDTVIRDVDVGGSLFTSKPFSLNERLTSLYIILPTSV